MLPNRDDILYTVNDCCQSIGLLFSKPAQLEAYPINAFITDLENAAPTAWKTASLEAFSGMIQLHCLQQKCYIKGFDSTWFYNNKDKTMYDLTVYLTNNALDLE